MEKLIVSLQQRLLAPLPGLDAQMQMSPPIRGREVVIPDNVRRGGVLVLLFWDKEEWHLVLMKRVEDGSTHSGQISFPGGTWEDSDRDFIHTALREAEEEVGIPQQEVNFLGKLTELYIPPSNFIVYPSLGYMSTRPHFQAQTSEVAAILEVPLRELMADGIRGMEYVNLSGRKDFRIHVPTYTLQGHTIWGATAMMMSELITLLHEANSKG